MFLSYFKYCLFYILGVISLASCTVILKNYPLHKNIVVENKITITSPSLIDNKKDWINNLSNYWVDGIKAKRVNHFFIYTTINKPPIYDSNLVVNSMSYMRNYLASIGHFYPTLSFKASAIKHGFNRYRKKKNVTLMAVKVKINVGNPLIIDSVYYTFTTPFLSQLSKKMMDMAVVKKGSICSKQNLLNEQARLVNVFQDNGFYHFSTNQIVIIIDTLPMYDTLHVSIVYKRRCVITFLEKKTNDSLATIRYRIGTISLYPDSKITDPIEELKDNPTLLKYKNDIGNGVSIYQGTKRFVYPPIVLHLSLHKGDIYHQNQYYRTINSFNKMGSWQQIDVLTKEQQIDSLRYINFYFFMYYLPRYRFSVDFQTARVTGDITAGNLLGIANILSFSNTNTFKRAILSTTTIRNGIELGVGTTASTGLLQTFQSSVSHSISFPSFLIPFKVHLPAKVENPTTVISLIGTYTSRTQFYLLRSLVVNMAYQWVTQKESNRKNVFSYSPIDVGLYALDSFSLLDTALKYNPYLANAFNTGYVVDQNFSFFTQIASRRNPNFISSFSVRAEEAGAVLGRIPALNNKIYQYIKLSFEFKQLWQFKSTALAFRFFAAAGYNYVGQTLPFFKQYFAGGANSMRAWQLRQLGLGSSIATDTLSNNQFKDRYADMQLETNIEYRFPIVALGRIKFDGALFSDIGNVWSVKKTNITNAEFNITRLGKDIAIASGLGLRIDISNYFLIRFDWGYKIKDPARQTPNGWVSRLSYYDTRSNGVQVPNMAVQLGIGLPF